MTSPEATIATFTDAWSRQDFQTVYFLLSPRGEEGVLGAIGRFGFDTLIPGFDDSDVISSPLFRTDAADMASEYAADASRMFDILLFGAATRGKLPFTITAQAHALQGEPARDDESRFRLSTGGTPALLDVSLVRLSSGRWKIGRIMWEGSSRSSHPWGVTENGD